jgi:hypothetical protein
VIENKMLRKRKLGSYIRLHDLYFSPDTVWVIKSGMMKWIGNVAHITNCIVFEWESVKVRDCLEDLGVDQKIKLKWILQEYWINFSHDRDTCRGFVNTVMNLWAPYNMGSFFTS